MRRSKWLWLGMITFVGAGAGVALTSTTGETPVVRSSPGPCRPPTGFVDRPPPTALPFDRLVAHEESVIIAAPLARVLAAAKAVALEDTIQQGGSLPYVTGTYMLTPGEFDLAGSRRLTCLSDGSTLVEQILERSETTNPAEFRYVVWNYTSPSARAIQYGVGRFIHHERADGRTEVRWTYGFRLHRDRWPGFLGVFGDFLFDKVFLERDYARMMRATLTASKANVENNASGQRDRHRRR